VFGWLRRVVRGGGARAVPRDSDWVRVGILLCALRADTETAFGDEADRDSLFRRLQPFAGVSTPVLRAFVDEHADRLLKTQRRSAAIASLCAAAPTELGFRISTFALAADLVFAERRVLGFERRFLSTLARRLSAPTDIRNETLWVVAARYGFDLRLRKARALIAAPPTRGVFSAKPPVNEPVWTRGECLLAAFVAAAACDGVHDLSSATLSETLIGRSKLLRDLLSDDAFFGADAETLSAQRTRSGAEMADHVRTFVEQRFKPMLNFRGMDAIIVKIGRSLPRSRTLARALYAECADLVLATRDLSAAEERFLHMLGDALRLPPLERERIRRITAWKNRVGYLTLAAALGR
jgi:uncharacterized membrane protein YebE (DUF533 family)